MKNIISIMLVFWCSQNLLAATLQSAYEEKPCLEVNIDSTSGWRFGTNVEVGPCTGAVNQQFQIKAPVSDESGSTLIIQDKCLDIDQSESESWTQNLNIIVATCNGSASQQFDITTSDDGSISLRAHTDGRCLDIDLNNGDGWRYERNVHLWQCHGEPNQLWTMAIVPPAVTPTPTPTPLDPAR